MLALLGDGDDSGWRSFLERAESRLRVVLHFRMTAPVRAQCEREDVLQDVWAEAMRCFDRFEYRGPGSLQRWVTGILRRKLLEIARKGERTALLETDIGARRRTSSHPLLDAMETSKTGVSGNAERREMEARVQEVLSELPPPEREAILMKVYEGLSFREAGKLAGVDPATIHHRFRRGLRACATHFRDEG